SALGGGILLTAADILGRVVARPEEVDVGILVALVGAPFFIALVRRQRLRELRPPCRPVSSPPPHARPLPVQLPRWPVRSAGAAWSSPCSLWRSQRCMRPA